MFSSVFCSSTSCGCTCMSNWRAVSNSDTRKLPKEISLIGFSNTGSHTSRITRSKARTSVSGGTHPESTCRRTTAA